MNKNNSISTSNHYRGFPVMLGRDGAYLTDHMSKLLEILEWVMSRHTKIIVLRFDLFVGDTKPDMTRLNKYFIRDIRKEYGCNSQYFWCRERGTSHYNNGIHYHYVVFLQNKDQKAGLSLGRKVANLASKHLATITKKDTDAYDRGRVNPRGWWWLDRTKLSELEMARQKKLMIEAIKTNKQLRNLSIKRIKDRTFLPSKPLDSFLHECVYAISYLAKHKTKTDLDYRSRSYGFSPLRDDRNLPERRVLEIANNTKIVNDIFSRVELQQSSVI